MTNSNIHPFSSQEEIENEAADWLARLDSPVPPQGEELSTLKAWINRSPAHREALQTLTQFWHEANVLTELSFPLQRKVRESGGETQDSAIGFWQSLRNACQTLAWQGVGTMAVTLAVMLGLSTWVTDLWDNGYPTVAGNGIYETRIGEQNTITLVDGSSIQLNTGSRVEVDYTDARRSIALMQGEAHFDVSKDPSRPFEVAAGQGRVRAVGTAFTVRYAQPNSQTATTALAVTVTEGKVALEAVVPEAKSQDEEASDLNVEIAKLPKAIVVGTLGASQQVIYDPGQQQALGDAIKSLSKQDLAKQLAWREGLLLFDGEPLRTVVQELNRYTAIRIEILDPVIADYAVGGQFQLGDPRAMLQAMALSFNLELLEVNPNHIQLSKI